MSKGWKELTGEVERISEGGKKFWNKKDISIIQKELLKLLKPWNEENETEETESNQLSECRP